MSQPPNYPGKGRLTRAAGRAGSSAYQAVFEAVGAILMAAGIGFWVDRRYETAPVGLLVGVVIGFGAFVLRMVRLGKELHPQDGSNPLGESASAGPGLDDDEVGTGEAPGVSDILREDPEK